MVNTRSRRARTNTDNSDNIPEETVVVNPFATNTSSFAPFTESISGAGLPRRRNTAFGPAPSQPATARVSSLHALGSPDQSDFEYQVLYTADGNPVTVRMPCSNCTVIPTSEMEIPPSLTTITLADRMCQQLSTLPGPSRDRLSSFTPAQVPEEPENAETLDKVSPEIPANPGDPNPEGPGGPGTPRSSHHPSHSRSPITRASNQLEVAEQ
ncbi:hypothetical protein F5050DRAFT_1803840 [Lentinula boryana]|uniref:Uncharacterized protein n=1 Tax=Lentinula boryana TaxID=40481 RepID=A0ABQ8QQI2_9AGAR|nr:hypothetical protein F5050DRAFT_1803840 [Lentinula boryana]